MKGGGAISTSNCFTNTRLELDLIIIQLELAFTKFWFLFLFLLDNKTSNSILAFILNPCFSTQPPPTQGKYRGGHFKFVKPSMTVAQYHMAMQHLSVQSLSMQHLSVQHFSMQHLSRDNIWLFTIATTPVWTKQSNFKLATEPNQNLANSS